MRFVEVDDGLRLRFPGQSADFLAGFEMGALAAFLSFGLRECARTIAEASLEQAREIAEALKYRMVAEAGRDGAVRVRFLQMGSRPALRVVAGA